LFAVSTPLPLSILRRALSKKNKVEFRYSGPLWYEESFTKELSGKEKCLGSSACKGKMKLTKVDYPINKDGDKKATIMYGIELYACSVCNYTVFTKEQVAIALKRVEAGQWEAPKKQKLKSTSPSTQIPSEKTIKPT
jgi:DNA-directed RNA polymerase subunit RPC12/RpoP